MPLRTALEFVGPHRLPAKVTSLLSHARRPRRRRTQRQRLRPRVGSRHKRLSRPRGENTPKPGVTPKFAVRGLTKRMAQPPEGAFQVRRPGRGKEPPIIDITGEGEAAETSGAKQGVPTPEAIRRSRRLATELAFVPMDVAEVSPYFREQLCNE